MFEEILSYIYSGTLHVSLDIVQHLYQAADLLQLSYVRDTCSSYMAMSVKRSTCVDLYKFADAFSADIVLKRCLQYICRHFVKVASSEEFCSLSVDQLTEIISHDELDVTEETRVWEAVVRWVQYSREDRLHHLPSILPHIRFNLLTSDDTAAILNHPLVREDPGSIQVIRSVVSSTLKKRFGMDTLEMACLLMVGEVLCFNPREGKYTKISLPPPEEGNAFASVAGMTVTSNNDMYILLNERHDRQISVLEYNQAWKEWENAGMSPIRHGFGMKKFFVEVEEHLYLLSVESAGFWMERSTLVWTRRYNRDTDEWLECSQLRIVEGEQDTFSVAVPYRSHIYFLTNSEVHRYDPSHDQWDARTPPRTIPKICTAVAMGTEIFCTDDDFSKIMVYGTESDSWETREPWLNPRNLVITPPYLFVLENQLHIWIEPDNNLVQEGEEEDSLVLVYDRSDDAWLSWRDLKANLPTIPCYAVQGHMCTMARMYKAPTIS
ncbi:Broad-Complex, Tramtrack and Bric a brac [Branchiostoma belcheri]|nr:Broad-Complex, Tramtrack and Bric a brac [Branchiostoma belcheri]